MGPLRTCIGCRGRDEQANLVRLVRVGDDVVDATVPRLPGRGGYLHRDARCWGQAGHRRAVQRCFGAGARLIAAPGVDWEQGLSAR